jgi:hypothetical protein
MIVKQVLRLHNFCVHSGTYQSSKEHDSVLNCHVKVPQIVRIDSTLNDTILPTMLT